MAESETQTDFQVTSEWMRIAGGVAQGLLTPQEGVRLLQTLADTHPTDCEWITEEAEKIRHQFALDILDAIHNAQGGYWDKLLSVIEALLDERLDHQRALELLTLVDAQHPENHKGTAELIDEIRHSPLHQFLAMDDQ